MDADVRLVRKDCVDVQPNKWDWQSDISFENAAIQHDRLAVPLQHADARLHVTRDRIERLSLRGAIAGVSFDLNGQVSFFDAGRHHGSYRANLLNAELSDDLFSALPTSIADWLRKLHPSGRLNAQIALESDESKGLILSAAELQLTEVNVEFDLSSFNPRS